jgi:uncharacterized protein DUF4331
MRRSFLLAPLLVVAAASTAVVVAVARGPSPPAASASSHREAPLISSDPNADNTDLYAFVSKDKPNAVTIIANYVPLEEPAGGPNFNSFGDDVLYAINIDNTGDGKEDISYQFRFDTKIRNRETFLYNTGQITSLNDLDWNMPQTYSVVRVAGENDDDDDDDDGGNRGRVIGRNLPTPPVNVGPRSTPNYDALASAAVKTLDDGSRVFAGQRDDPFYVDLGSIFDLAGLRPFNSLHLIPLPNAAGVDNVDGFNTHTIALQVPIQNLTRNHKLPAGASDPNGVIGIYANASRQSIRIHNSQSTIFNLDRQTHGRFVQVSRLGNPLINEVIIPLGKKDFWNASDPSGDQQFLKYYENAELASLANFLYPPLTDAPTSGRTDLTAVLLTGVPGVTFTGNTKADLLRLNTGIPPSAAVGEGKVLGALAGDLAGFPNGRRLEDDVVDIELRAVTCGYGDILEGILGLCNLNPNKLIGDGVDGNDKPLATAFPYVPTPHQGYDHAHDHANHVTP